MIGLTWHMLWYSQYLWWRLVEWVRKNRETNEEHDEGCVEEGFQLSRVKFGRDGEGGREALGIKNCSII